MKEKIGVNKNSVLFKELDLIFVYSFIFFIGLAIVLVMTTYLNNKVKEFNREILSSASR